MLFRLLTACTFLLRRKRRSRSPQVAVQRSTQGFPSESVLFSDVCGAVPESYAVCVSGVCAPQAILLLSVVLYHPCSFPICNGFIPAPFILSLYPFIMAAYPYVPDPESVSHQTDHWFGFSLRGHRSTDGNHPGFVFPDAHNYHGSVRNTVKNPHCRRN